MQYILVVVATFALCFGVDKLFMKLFRSKVQHQSGLSVRLSKRYATVGIVLIVIGIAALISVVMDTWVLAAGGVIVVIMGVCLIVYYMSFGIFYDADSFILTTFGKKSTTYAYRNIRGQQLYVIQGGGVIVELHMTDGTAVQLQSTMEGMEKFLNHAFAAWLRQTGRRAEACTFHDPANCCWFPSMETEA